MFLTPNPFDKMGREELAQYVNLLTELFARLIADDSNEDHRRSPKILNAKYLATIDVKRALESLTAYLGLLEEPPGEAAA